MNQKLLLPVPRGMFAISYSEARYYLQQGCKIARHAATDTYYAIMQVGRKVTFESPLYVDGFRVKTAELVNAGTRTRPAQWLVETV
jgi:hypothetical protein